MTNELDLAVSQLCMRMEQAEQLLQWLVDNGSADEQLCLALESLHIAKINLNGFLNDSD